MSPHILDTDMLTLAQRGHRIVMQRIHSFDPSELAITVVTIEEQLSGWYTLLRKTSDPAKLARVYERLAKPSHNTAVG
jgi:tRNA(fMet)-specific endonuclease VapC